jgi:hypothetical protein
MDFYIGQKVRKVRQPPWVVENPGNLVALGDEGVIKAFITTEGYPSASVFFLGEQRDRNVALSQLEPDKADYERFMERVLKPVDLGQPVTA